MPGAEECVEDQDTPRPLRRCQKLVLMSLTTAVAKLVHFIAIAWVQSIHRPSIVLTSAIFLLSNLVRLLKNPPNLMMMAADSENPSYTGED